MIVTFSEIIDVVLMTAIVGYIFMDLFHRVRGGLAYSHKFDWDAFKIACLITAPAIIFHELGHKFIAMAYGYNAVFHAAYLFLGVGVLLKLMRTGFIFFVPAFVSIACKSAPCSIPPGETALIAAAGPLINLVLFGVAYGMLKFKKKMSNRERTIWHLTKMINLFLFIFNMLPIPGFDGSKVFAAIGQLFP